MVDVYLLNPPGLKPDKMIRSYAPSSPPLGLCYLSSSLKNDNISVKAFDFDLKDTSLEFFMNNLKDDKPSIIGITSLTHNYPAAITLAKVIKEYSEEIKVVLGGNHATFCYEDILITGYVDYVVIGEAEASFAKLARALLNGGYKEEIPGIACIKNNALSLSPPDDVVDLDTIPFPDRSLFNLEKYYDPINVISSRGCQAKCIFCSASAFRKGKTRFRSSQNFLEEIKQLYSSGFRSFNFMDDNFMLKPARTEEICKGLIKLAPEAGWTCSARAEFVNKGNIRLLAKSGCKGMHFGLESPCLETQKSIQKHLSIEKLEKALKLCRQFDIFSYCSLILGLPGENTDTINETINYAIHLNHKYHTSIVFGILTPFPGTPLYNNPQDYGIEIVSRNYMDYDIYTPVIKTQYFAPDVLRALLYDAQKAYLSGMSKQTVWQMDIFGSILKNFK